MGGGALAQWVCGTFSSSSKWAISCFRVVRTLARMVNALFSSINVKKQAREGSFLLRIVYLMHTHCWKNVDLMFLFLMSWRPSERIGLVLVLVPHSARLTEGWGWGGQKLFGLCLMPIYTDQISKRGFPYHHISIIDCPHNKCPIDQRHNYMDL